MSTSNTTARRPRGRGTLALVVAVSALAIPASASAYYGSVSENGAADNHSATGAPSSDSGLVIPNHEALNESLAPASGSTKARGSEQPPALPALSPVGDGFDWADAALGAGAALALVALGAAALITVRRQQPV